MAYKIKDFYDTRCLKIAGVVGIGIHLYSVAINNQHFEGIYNDFATGHPIRGTLKTAVPFLLPYCVSFYTRKKAKKEFMEKIGELENKIKDLEKNKKSQPHCKQTSKLIAVADHSQLASFCFVCLLANCCWVFN